MVHSKPYEPSMLCQEWIHLSHHQLYTNITAIEKDEPSKRQEWIHLMPPPVIHQYYCHLLQNNLYTYRSLQEVHSKLSNSCSVIVVVVVPYIFFSVDWYWIHMTPTVLLSFLCQNNLYIQKVTRSVQLTLAK